MTAKQKAAIEVAAKLPTAEETLRKHIDNSDPMNEPFDEMYVGETNAMLDAIEFHTAAYTAALWSDIKQLQRLLENSIEAGEELRERVKELEAENEKLRKISDGYALLYEENERLKSELEKKMTQKTVDCPMCLFSSGTVANGRGTKCSACNGTGRIRKSVYIKLRNIYGDLIR